MDMCSITNTLSKNNSQQLHMIAKQWNEFKRANYRHLVAGIYKHQFLFIDESAKDDNNNNNIDDRTFQVKSVSLPPSLSLWC